MPKPNLKRATTRFAEIARKTGGVFVFASRDATLPNRDNTSAELAGHEYANHKCKHCSSVFAFPKTTGAQPFCVLCGGDVDVKEDVKPSIAPDDELSYLTCAGCGTTTMFNNTLAGVGAHIHCSACGTNMLEKADSEGADEDDDDNAEDVGFEDADEDEDEEEVDAADIDDMDLLDLEDDLDDGAEEKATTTNEDTVGTKPNAKDLPDDAGADRGPGAPDSALQDGKADNPGIETTTQNPGALEPSVTKADAEEMPNNDYGDDSMDMDLVDVGEDDMPIEAISFFYSDKKVHLATHDQIIATLAEADAGAYQEMLQTEQFRMAVATTIETDGLKKAIAEYKFKPSKVTIKISKVVKAKVEAALKSQKIEVEASADGYAAQFQHSLDIAAAGYAGNFWRNKHDPLKTALIAEMASLGIRKSESVVDKIFAQYSVAHIRDVLEMARELAKKPVLALNALAETIDMVKYVPTSKKLVAAADDADGDDSTGEGDGEDEDDEDEDGEFATATPVEVVIASTKHSSYKTPELRKILGDGTGSFFN